LENCSKLTTAKIKELNPKTKVATPEIGFNEGLESTGEKELDKAEKKKK